MANPRIHPRPPRPTPPRSNGVGWILLALIILLIFAVTIVAYVYYRKQQQAENQPAPQVATATSPDLISDDRIIFGGVPRPIPGAGPETAFQLLKNRAYMVGYSETRRDPLWCAYRVFHTSNPFNLPRPTGGFLTDTRTAAQVKDRDFTRSGYDRGHMAPNSAIMHDFGGEAQLETFLLSNICPQSPALNEKVWERLEAMERQYEASLEEIWVIDGPIFADLNGGTTERLASGIAVPTAFYKILLDEQGGPGGKPRLFAVIMPQNVKGTELPQQFTISVREIEKETHLDFFWKLDDATESELETRTWPVWSVTGR